MKDFGISLAHSNRQFNINNQNDVDNLDSILTLIIKNKDNQDKLKEILEKTTLGYLRRLQEDGLLADRTGPNIVPVFDPLVPDKAIEFKSAGGYPALYRATQNVKPRWKTWISKWWWSFVIPIVVGLILIAIEKGWFT